MSRLPPLAVCAILWTATACTDATKETGETGDTGDTGDTGAPSGRGLPEGSSAWTGTMEVGGFNFLLDLSLENSGGDLVAIATFSDDPENPSGLGSATYQLTGTHEPVSGLVALAPDDWVGEARDDLELLGATATFDPESQTLEGMIVDYASGGDNSLVGGPLVATLESGDGAPTVEGDRGRALAAGSHSFSGNLQCTSSVRETEGTLDYDGQGAITGTLIVGDTSVSTPLGTFEFTAVHNPTTGGLTLVPGLWVDPDHTTVTFFVDGAYDPSTSVFAGDQRTNGNHCPDDTWNVVID